MSDDYYKTLGIGREATAAEIQKAYRALAKKHHPDLNPDDKTAKQKFQQVQQAYDVLSDAQKREMYDQFGPNYEAAAQARKAGAAGGGWAPQGGAAPDFSGFDFSQVFGGGGGSGAGQGGMPGDLEDLLRQFTGGGSGGGGGFESSPRSRRRRGAATPGPDIEHEVNVPFQTAVSGGEVALRLRRGSKNETITAKIPAGIGDGQTLRLKGQGGESNSGGPNGDLRLTVHVEPHASYTRDGLDLNVKVPVTLAEAALGAKIDIPTPHGVITMSVPAGTSSGKRIRAKGYGVRKRGGDKGDLYAEILIAIPKPIDAEAADLIKRLDAHWSQELRQDLAF